MGKLPEEIQFEDQGIITETSRNLGVFLFNGINPARLRDFQNQNNKALFLNMTNEN